MLMGLGVSPPTFLSAGPEPPRSRKEATGFGDGQNQTWPWGQFMVGTPKVMTEFQLSPSHVGSCHPCVLWSELFGRMLSMSWGGRGAAHGGLGFQVILIKLLEFSPKRLKTSEQPSRTCIIRKDQCHRLSLSLSHSPREERPPPSSARHCFSYRTPPR